MAKKRKSFGEKGTAVDECKRLLSYACERVARSVFLKVDPRTIRYLAKRVQKAALDELFRYLDERGLQSGMK